MRQSSCLAAIYFNEYSSVSVNSFLASLRVNLITIFKGVWTEGVILNLALLRAEGELGVGGRGITNELDKGLNNASFVFFRAWLIFHLLYIFFQSSIFFGPCGIFPFTVLMFHLPFFLLSTCGQLVEFLDRTAVAWQFILQRY